MTERAKLAKDIRLLAQNLTLLDGDLATKSGLSIGVEGAVKMLAQAADALDAPDPKVAELERRIDDALANLETANEMLLHTNSVEFVVKATKILRGEHG